MLTAWYNRSYTLMVKTAISIPDSVFEEAEGLAKQRRMSRSELYAKAIAEYIKTQRRVGVRERLDAVYQGHPEESDLDLAVQAMQARSVPREKW